MITLPSHYDPAPHDRPAAARLLLTLLWGEPAPEEVPTVREIEEAVRAANRVRWAMGGVAR